MYFPDMSPCHLGYKNTPMIAIGWLEHPHPFNTEAPSQQFLARLQLFCTHVNIASMGIHECEFCPQPARDIYIDADTRRYHLGSGIMLAFGQRNSVYAAPD